MNKKWHLTLYDVCDYLALMGLEFILVSKIGRKCPNNILLHKIEFVEAAMR